MNFKPYRLPRRTLNFLFILISFISLLSCQKDRSALRPDLGFYFLEKEREFIIHSLTSVELLDYYPDDRIYLGYTHTPEGNEICLIDQTGKILLSRNMQGEGPEQYTSNLSCLGFSETGEVLLMTSVQVLRYDQNLKLLERFSYETKFMITLYSLLKKFFYIRKDTNRSEITFPVVPSGVARYDPGNYSRAKLLDFYDQRQSYTKEIAPVSERRITEEFFEITGGSYGPVYALDTKNGKLYLTSTFDNEITIYDLYADSLAGSVDIYHGDPSSVEPPAPFGSHTLSSTPENLLRTPINKSIHLLDNGLIVLEYLMEGLVNPNPKGKYNFLIKSDISQNRLILFDQNQQLSRDLALPEQGIVMTSLPGNRLLVKVVNPEKEEDFTRYSIFKLINKP